MRDEKGGVHVPLLAKNHRPNVEKSRIALMILGEQESRGSFDIEHPP